MQVWFGAVSRIRFARGALDAIEADLRLSFDLEPLVPEPSFAAGGCRELAVRRSAKATRRGHLRGPAQ